MSNRIFWILGISVAVILLVGRTIFTILLLLIPRQGAVPIQTQETDSIATRVAQTIEVELTRQAVESAYTPTNTPQPIVTETPTASLTPEIVIPTNTSISPTVFVPTSTQITTVCDRAQFVRDVSVQDNTLMSPGSSFVKTWRLKNIGHCTWTPNYKLVFRFGDAMDANQSISLPGSVEPNQTIDVSVAMKAPKKDGTYRGDWMLSNPSGTRFGIGSSGSKRFGCRSASRTLGIPTWITTSRPIIAGQSGVAISVGCPAQEPPALLRDSWFCWTTLSRKTAGKMS